MVNFSHFDSVFALTSHFTSNEICKDFLAQQRWDDDVVCPYCGEHHCYRCVDGRFLCPNRDCHKKFNSTVGTIFEASRIPLTKWFLAIYLVSSHKKGISSHQLGRDISVTQKTAWFMLQKVRSCFAQDDSVALEGEVEIDEAYVGGDNKWRHEWKKKKHGQGGANKSAIFGMIQRDNGHVVAIHVPNTTKETIIPIINQFIEVNGTTIYTDESVIYKTLTKENGYKHFTCNHSLKEFSVGGVGINSMEGFRSHFKRMIDGVYHHISIAYLQRYVDEECFRWNTKHLKSGARFEIVFGACLGKFTYDDVKSVVRNVA